MTTMTLREAHEIAVSTGQPVTVTIRQGEREMTTRVSKFDGGVKMEHRDGYWVAIPEAMLDQLVEVA